MGLDTKIYWLTDRQSQCDFDLKERNQKNGNTTSYNREYENENWVSCR
jgi:hypothetical protein